MMTSSNGNIFRVSGPLWGESTEHRWVPLTKASGTELWCFFICAWTNAWANNRDAVDLRRHGAHYDVTVMELDAIAFQRSNWQFPAQPRLLFKFMMTSSNGNLFRVTGHLCGEFTGHLLIPRTKASDAELWCFLWFKQVSKQSWGWWFETLSRPFWRHCNVYTENVNESINVCWLPWRGFTLM